MTTHVLAQVNIAKILYPLDSFEMQDFTDNLNRVNQLAERSAGFVWRLETADGDATAIRDFGDDIIVNMSTWTDIESLHNFVYKSAHTEFLRRRKEWFSTIKTYHALWWQNAKEQPTTEQAAKKLSLLEQHGPSAEVFTFMKSRPMPAIDS